MKNNKYETPAIEVIEIEVEGVICASGAMNMQNGGGVFDS